MLLALTAALALGLPPQSSLCRQLPLAPVAISPSAFHEHGLDVALGMVAARVNDAAFESIQIRQRRALGWSAPEVIPAPGGLASGFGLSIDIESEFFGPELMATDPGFQHALGSGQVHRFTRQVGPWTTLPPFRTDHPDAQVFGTNLERSGPLCAVQSQRYLFASTESLVHLFEPLGAIVWVETFVLEHPVAGGDSSAFGSAMAVDDGLLVISSQEQPRGRAWIWRHTSPSQLSAPQELVPSSPVSRGFGTDVAVSAGVIAVSDPYGTGLTGQPESGQVLLFEPVGPGGTFVETTRLVAPTPTSLHFGRDIDMEGDRLAVCFAVQPNPFPDLRRVDGLAVLDGVTGGAPEAQWALSTLGDELTAVGRVVALGEGEALTTSTLISVGNALRFSSDLRRFAVDEPSALICDGLPNSSGVPGELHLVGCATRASLTARADDLPPSVFALALIGSSAANVPLGSGVLCIGNPQRAVLTQADASGTAQFTLDPSRFGFDAGDTPVLQLWHRDMPQTANLTEAIATELAL